MKTYPNRSRAVAGARSANSTASTPRTQVGRLAKALFCAITAPDAASAENYGRLAERYVAGLTPAEIEWAKAKAMEAVDLCTEP